MEEKRGRCITRSITDSTITNSANSKLNNKISPNSILTKKLFSKKLHTKSQITLFIIIGLIVIVLLVIGYYFLQQKQEFTPTQTFSEDSKPIQAFVQQCLMDSSLKAITLAAVQGGSISLSQKNINTQFGNVAYAMTYEKNKNQFENMLLDENAVGQEIASYINLILPECANNFTAFNKQVEFQTPKAEVTIADDKVIVNLNYAVKINDEIIDKYQVEVPLRLGHLRAIANQIIQNQLQQEGIQKNFIDMDYLQQFDVKADLVPINEDTILLVLSDISNNQKMQTTELIFASALQFPINKAPQIILQDEFVIKDGISFTTKAKVDDESPQTVELRDDSALFNIQQDGTISFTAEIPGEYIVTITAIDEFKQESNKKIKFIVIS